MSVLFVIYINDLSSKLLGQCDSYLYADDAKLYKNILSDEDAFMLNESCSALSKWSDLWLMQLNFGKCKTMSIRGTSKNK